MMLDEGKNIKDIAKERGLKLGTILDHVEQIKKFELLPHEWTIDTGEMTPKLSLKRKVVMEKFRDAIERIYA